MISFEIRLPWVKKHLERKSWGFLLDDFFGGGEHATFFKAFRHTFQEVYRPLDCLHEKIIFDPCNKKLRGMGKFVNARCARFTNSNP